MALTGNYYYLLSSLPYLTFGSKPPISHANLSERIRPWLSGSSLGLFEKARIALDSPPPEVRCKTLRSWFEFEHGLRAELARRRTDGRDRSERPGGASLGRILAAVDRAFRAAHPLEGEIRLITERWEYLTELGAVQYFNLPALIIYSLKLQLLERLSTFDEKRGLQLAESIYERNIHGGKGNDKGDDKGDQG